MQLQIQQVDIFSVRADAIFLPIDGLATGMEGSVARQFDRRYPDVHVLEEMEAQLDYPIQLGDADLVELEPPASPYRFAIVLSMLHHRENLDARAKANQVSRALSNALDISDRHSCESAVTPLLVGGWRLGPRAAFSAMLSSFSSFRGSMPKLVTVCSRDSVDDLTGLAASLGF